MSNQKFPRLTIHFNLRSSTKENKPTPIYAVVRHEGTQHKLATGVKVRPFHWNHRFEVCIRSPFISPVDDLNNALANKRLKRIRFACNQGFSYLYGTPHAPSWDEVKDLIFKDLNMRPPKTLPVKERASYVLQEEFERRNRSIKESSKKTHQSSLNKFLKFLEESGIPDTPSDVFTQKTLVAFQTFLIDEEIGSNFINNACGLVVRLINGILPLSNHLEHIKVRENIGHDVGQRRPLTNEELCALRDAELGNALEREVRDIFILQCHTGQRIGDIPRLFDDDATTKIIENQEFIEIITTKESIKADVIIDDEAKRIIEKYRREGFKALKIKTWKADTFGNKVNKTLKLVAQKAGLTNEIEWTVSVGGKPVLKKAPLYSILSSHWARHTFITRKLLEGITPENLCALTGHADDTMIRTTYGHLTCAEKAGNAVKQMRQFKGLATQSEPPTAKTPEAIQAMLSELERDEMVVPKEFPVPIPGDPYHQRLERKGEFVYNGVSVTEGSEAYEKRMRILFSAFRNTTHGESEASLRQILDDIADIRREFEEANNLEVLESAIFSLQDEGEALRTNPRARQDLEGYRFEYEVKRSKLYFFEEAEKHIKNRLKTFSGVRPSTPDGREGH